MLSLTRRFSHFLAAAALAMGALGPQLASAATEFVSIKGATVNIREKPSTHSPTLWELGRGYPLQVTQRKGKWLKVRDFESSLGWVHSPLTTKTPHMVITARTANLRSGPGEKFKRVGRLEQHEVVRTLKKSDGWAQVRRENGQQGWVARRLAWGW